MTKYAIRAKAASSVRLRDFPHACLGVSLGNGNEQGDKLRAIVEWLNDNFESATIDLSDTLYRWNEHDGNGRPLPDAADRARARGDRWILDNREALDALIIPTDFVRWDYWLLRPDFAFQQSRFENLYHSNEKFRAAVDIDVEDFLNRQRKLGRALCSDADAICRQFVLEEATVHTMLFRDRPDAISVYPGGALMAMAVIRRGEIHDAPQGLQGVPFVSLRVERTSPAISEPRRHSQIDTKPAA